jgi:hypothetical protein
MKVQVELDRWDRRGEVPAYLDGDDMVTTTLGTVWNAKRKRFRNAIFLARDIQRGDYRFRVTVEEYRGESFLVRASVSILSSLRKGRVSRKTALRERPLKPVAYATGDIVWTFNREGVFAGLPPEWDDYWANNFIKQTLDYLRSPEIPKHYELHGDNPEEM